jgi:hypothetical protein
MGEQMATPHNGYYGHFADPATMEPLPEDSCVVEVGWLPGGRGMVLRKDVVFVDPECRKWVADEGEIIDGLSVPRFLWRIQPPFVGRAREASVIHDSACVKKERPSPMVHWVFWCAMRTRGVHPVVAFTRWAAVRVFGPRFKGGDP